MVDRNRSADRDACRPTSRRQFLQTAGSAAVAAAAAPAILKAEDKAGSQSPRVGSGEHVYEAVHGWGEVPEHVRWGETHGVAIDEAENKPIVHLGYDPEWTKQVLANGFEMRVKPDLWRPGRFIHPHDACYDRDGNIFVVEWVPTGRVTFLRKVS